MDTEELLPDVVVLPDIPENKHEIFKGAAGELKVALDLISRGYEVFKAYSNFSCDLMVRKDGQTAAIEVKHKKGGSRGPVGGKAARHFDVLARVHPDGNITYQRSVFHVANGASGPLVWFNNEYATRTSKKLQKTHSEATYAVLNNLDQYR